MLLKFKYIIYLLFILFIIQSCISLKLKKANEVFPVYEILNDSSTSYLYKTEIQLYDNYFSGMTVIKAKKESHRIVFLNEIGMKFYDIELHEDSYTLHHIFGPMKKDMFIKLLLSDFKQMLMYDTYTQYKTEEEFEAEFYYEKGNYMYIFKPNNQKLLYYIDKISLMPQKSVKYSFFRKHTFVTYEDYDYDKRIPKKISIDHKNFKFNMKMNYLKQ